MSKDTKGEFMTSALIEPAQHDIIDADHPDKPGFIPPAQIKAIGQTELNTSNPEEVLQLAAQKRKKRFLQAMAKLYF